MIRPEIMPILMNATQFTRFDQKKNTIHEASSTTQEERSTEASLPLVLLEEGQS